MSDGDDEGQKGEENAKRRDDETNVVRDHFGAIVFGNGGVERSRINLVSEELASILLLLYGQDHTLSMYARGNSGTEAGGIVEWSFADVSDGDEAVPATQKLSLMLRLLLRLLVGRSGRCEEKKNREPGAVVADLCQHLRTSNPVTLVVVNYVRGRICFAPGTAVLVDR